MTINSEELPVLKSYRAPLTQIFNSLLDNAIRYSRGNVTPHIEISVKEKVLYWEFSVKDNGIGIEEEFFDKIFVIFQQLHNRKK
ncbi:MAG: ATP-binding protein [Bacteroidota bacterium]